MILHVTPSSYRVYLSPCEVWVLKAPLKLGDECHGSVRGPSDVLASDRVAGPLLCHALGAECQDGQQQAPCVLSVPEAELAQPWWAGGSAMKSGPAQAVVRVLWWAPYPASAWPRSRRRV